MSLDEAISLKPHTPCPACGEPKLRIDIRLVPQEFGTYSVAGAQMKVAAKKVPYLVCDGCKVEAKAKGL